MYFLPCCLSNSCIYILYTNKQTPLFSFPFFTVLDTAAGVWLDRNGIVSSRSNKGHDYDPFLELMRRCRHAAAAVGVQIYIYGGLRGGKFETNLPYWCS